MIRQGVMRKDGHGDRRVGINDDSIRKFGGVNFAPTYGFAGRSSGEAPGVGTGVGDLNEKVLSDFFDAQHFLNLRFGLEHEVFGTAATPKHHAAAAAATFGREHKSSGFVDIDGGV